MDGPSVTGGQGDAASADLDLRPLSREEMTLLRRAARQRWGVPDPLMTEVLLQIQDVLASGGRRNKLAAARLLVTLTRIDQLDERLAIEKQKHAEADDTDARAALLAEAEDLIRGKERGQGDCGA